MKLIKSIKIILVLSLLFAIPQIVYSEAANPYSIRNITDGKRMDYHPAYSPDGKEIVFVTKIEKKKRGQWPQPNRAAALKPDVSPFYLNISLMDSEGKNRRLLTSGDVMDFFPSFTPDGEKILFVSNREGGVWNIWSIKKDGSGLTRITNSEDKEFSPHATPDGNQIVFFGRSNKSMYVTESVYVMSMNGENLKRLTSGGKGDWYPSMSPDGKEILFTSMRLAHGNLWTIDSEGKSYKRLTFGDSVGLFPAWSPDGSKIAYVSREGRASIENFKTYSINRNKIGPSSMNRKEVLDVWVMDRDGKNKRQLTKQIARGEWGSRLDFTKVIDLISNYRLSWHPDGNKIALTTWDPGQKGSYISILEFDALDKLPVEKEEIPDYTLLGEKEITKGDWDDFGPSFHPNGKSLIFSSNKSGNWDIWSIGVDSENLRQLTKKTDDEIAPAFSPDGKEIAFLKKDSGGRDQGTGKTEYSLWTMKSDGSHAKQLMKDISVLSYPSWNPAGKELVFVAEGERGAEIWMYNIAQGSKKRILVDTGFLIIDSKKNQAAANRMQQPGSGNYQQNPCGGKQHFPFKEFLYRVDFNEDGSKITFESKSNGSINIWVMDRNGSNRSQITSGERPHWNPVFSPGGKMIAYSTDKLVEPSGPPFWPTNNYNIWIADPESKKELAITGEEQTDWNPVWSPNGKQIAYVTNRSGEFENFSIWMLYLK